MIAIAGAERAGASAHAGAMSDFQHLETPQNATLQRRSLPRSFEPATLHGDAAGAE
jgi:hypothetical protein